MEILYSKLTNCSSITSQRGGEISADPGYALVNENIGKCSSENDTAANVRPSTSHNAEDLYTKVLHVIEDVVLFLFCFIFSFV